MALGGRKRANVRAASAQMLEERLDHMKASKAERELARGVFRQLADSPNPPAYNAIVRRSVGAVVRARKASADGLVEAVGA